MDGKTLSTSGEEFDGVGRPHSPESTKSVEPWGCFLRSEVLYNESMWTMEVSEALRRVLRRVLPARWFPDRPRCLPVWTPWGGRRMWLRPRRHRAMMVGWYERDVSRWIDRHVRPGMWVVDGGAHVGYHTLHLARQVGPHGRVFAVEMDPRVLPLLKKNVALHGFQGRVVVREGALGPHTGWTRVSYAGPHGVLDPRGEARVPMWSLEDAVEGRCVQFVKLDVEGAEWEVLRGAFPYLNRCKPILLIAFHDVPDRILHHPLVRRLTTLGYRIQPLSPPGEEVRWVFWPPETDSGQEDP